jgi:flagellar hook-length control protein FliK
MTQTNTEYLLQIIPAVDRTYGAAGANDDAGAFDDHLSQAATLSGDESRFASGSQRTDSARTERDEPSWNTSDFKPNSREGASTTSSPTSSSAQEESADQVSESKPASEDAERDEHDPEKSDDTTAAEIAGAGQAAKGNCPKSNPNTEPNADANRLGAAKAAALGKTAATSDGDRKATGTADDQPTNSAALTDLAKQHADEATQLEANAASDVVETTVKLDETQVTDSDGQQSKAEIREASPRKLDKGVSKKNEHVTLIDSPDESAASGETSPDDGQKVIAGAEAAATQAAAPAAKGKLETDRSSDDDSRNHSQNEAGADARNDLSVQTNKLDTAQLAVSAAGPTDTVANATSKSKDDEQVTKPILAKSEPAAAAFARMARNNVMGSKDSTSRTNDLPPIDPSRFIGRVAKAFQTAQDRGGTLQLRLSPPELGALRIELNVKDGVMSAALQTETSAARRLLLDHLPALRDRLAEQNIRVDRFDVDVRQEGAGGQTDTRGSQQQQFQHEPDQPAPRRPMQAERPRDTVAPAINSTAPSVSDAGLNLIV